MPQTKPTVQNTITDDNLKNKKILKLLDKEKEKCGEFWYYVKI